MMTDRHMYFGGLSGGQLEKWQTGKYDPEGLIPPDNKPALYPRVVKMAEKMLEFKGPVGEAEILDQKAARYSRGIKVKCFLKQPGCKYRGKYYLSYSTGYSRHIAYAIADNPMGPFTFTGYVLKPVVGWTTHHSIVEYKEKWYLFYHDSIMSGGVMHLRTAKIIELKYNKDGTIVTFYPDKL